MPNQLVSDAQRLALHPKFPQAVQAYCVELARLREAPWLLNALIATEARWRIIGYLLYLASDTERFGPQGGATYGRMLDLCTQRQEVKPRVLKTLLGLLKFSGVVTVVPDAQDRRIGYYRTTPKFDGFTKAWLTYAATALDLLEPKLERQSYLDDPAFAIRFNVSGGRAHLSDEIPLVDRMPQPLADLNVMSGSFSIIVGVMEADTSGLPPPSRAGLASRFGLSRGQVLNIIKAGVSLGLFQAGKSSVGPTPLLREVFHQWVSIELAFYARHLRPPHEPLPPVCDHLL